MQDIFGYLNADQARKTVIAAGIAGALAALGVVIADLPKIIDVAMPLSAALVAAFWQAKKYLETGDLVKDAKK